MDSDTYQFPSQMRQDQWNKAVRVSGRVFCKLRDCGAEIRTICKAVAVHRVPPEMGGSAHLDNLHGLMHDRCAREWAVSWKRRLRPNLTILVAMDDETGVDPAVVNRIQT